MALITAPHTDSIKLLIYKETYLSFAWEKRPQQRLVVRTSRKALLFVAVQKRRFSVPLSWVAGAARLAALLLRRCVGYQLCWPAYFRLPHPPCQTHSLVSSRQLSLNANKKARTKRTFLLAGAVRFELTTLGFGDRCSTNWAIPLQKSNSHEFAIY